LNESHWSRSRPEIFVAASALLDLIIEVWQSAFEERGQLMFIKCMSSGLITLLLFFGSHQTISAQTSGGNNSADTAKTKANVLKHGASEKSQVEVKLRNGTKMKGSISQVGDDSFTLTDSKLKQTNTLTYSNVAQVKRSGLSIGAKIAIGVGIFAAVMVVALAISTDGHLGNLGSR
jgi:hypothetical protein